MKFECENIERFGSLVTYKLADGKICDGIEYFGYSFISFDDLGVNSGAPVRRLWRKRKYVPIALRDIGIGVRYNEEVVEIWPRS